jgi:hypothetical protein
MSIDYGNGLTNIDHESGIRYGVIHTHSVGSDALRDVYDHGDNLTYKAAVDDARAQITHALTGVLDNLGVLPYVSRYAPTSADKQRQQSAVDAVVDSVWEAIEQDWNDQYEENEDTYRYEQDGYVIETSSLGVFVLKSPFYTFAAFCSPCAPGAGNLDSTAGDGAKTYCLGRDWFDEYAPCPYQKIYRVDTHEEV